MNFTKRVSLLLSLTALTTLSGISAQAQTDTINTDESAFTAPVSPHFEGTDPATPMIQFTVPTDTAPESELAQTQAPAGVTVLEPITSAQTDANAVQSPTPGTIATTAAPLTTTEPPVNSQFVPSPAIDPRVAQSDVDPGRATQSGSSYIGAAGNIGLSGDSALGDGNFAVISKIGLTNTISVRPSAVLGDDTTFLIPVTYDFNFRPAEPFEEPVAFAPYVGGGVAFSTGDDSEFGVLLTGGVDVPLNAQFTATAAVNVGFLDETDIGLLVGVGFNFNGLGGF